MQETTSITNDMILIQVIFLGIAIFLMWMFCVVAARIERVFAQFARGKRDTTRRDVVRVYSKSERVKGMARCAHRCEGTGIFFRCRRRGDDLHGDHWYPHSRGGATTIKNLVMLCPKCNLRKSDKIPLNMQTIALSLRRSIGIGYNNADPKVGEWLKRGYQQNSVIGRLDDPTTDF